MNPLVKTEDDYEDLLGQWSNLESGLAMVLTHPDSVEEFEARIVQYDRWIQDLLKHDTNVALYLLFQLAINSTVGYSASHALVCAVLCQLIGVEFALPAAQRNGLVRAALTMNLAMTTLQDQLAKQNDMLSQNQQNAIRAHSANGVRMLTNKGISDALWLNVVAQHHREDLPTKNLTALAPVDLLSHILRLVDRYAAMISPRHSRDGRSAAESAGSIVQGGNEPLNAIGQTLVRIVGTYPPGTFITLEDGYTGIVTRRETSANPLAVAVVMNPLGQLLRRPHLATLSKDTPGIRGSLGASVAQERINHYLILQM